MKKYLLLVLLVMSGCTSTPDITLEVAVESALKKVGFHSDLEKARKIPYSRKGFIYKGINDEKMLVSRYSAKIIDKNGNFYHSIFSTFSYCAIGTLAEAKVKIDSAPCIKKFMEFEPK